ncbi:MAG TPA: sigma 54-interacting transcriptional regulator [Terriglobales bacterium]|nr:sigma 54-interacting transcriptional regulator [Terriglobales bacterium]
MSTLVAPAKTDANDWGMIVASEGMRSVMLLVERVANSRGSVLITGESGTGKELVARSIHQRSSRRDGPFIDLNCAALPEHLIESELFGYERGAFSGADQSKPGMFELANHGTLFLDEVGEIDGKIQAKLLRVLDGSPYYRLGGKQKIVTDVRVISATNRALDGSDSNGKFRLDLYHRLAQFKLQIPPLRERVADILPIAENYLQQIAPGATFSEDAKEALLSYRWPGNIRELRNFVFQATTVAGPEVIRKEHLPASIVNDNGILPLTGRNDRGTGFDLARLERDAIQQALDSTGGHQGRAAERLGISRRTLSRRLREYKKKSEPLSGNTLGTLNSEQKQCFRADAEFPVFVRSANGETSCVASNLSKTGVGLQKLNPRLYGRDRAIELVICLPNGFTIEAKGTVMWSRADGKAGVKFTSLDSTSESHLDDWITGKIAEEGWSAQD